MYKENKMTVYVKSLSLLTAKFVENQLVNEETGVYTPPVDGLIDLVDFNAPLDVNQGPMSGNTVVLPTIDSGATLNLNTGVVEGIGGNIENVTKITRLVNEILSIHQALLSETNTVEVVTGFAITKE